MRDYGKVHSTFWSSLTTAGMSDQAKVLSLYLMTCNHSTIAGVFRLPDGYVAEDLKWDAETVRKGFEELSANGFAMRCETTKWVWVVKHLDWNPPENPNQIKAAVKVASGVPAECGWKQAFMRVAGVSLGMKQEAPAEPLPNPSETLSKSVSVSVSGTEAVAGTGVGAADAASPKACRLPADWVLPKAWGEWTVEEFPAWKAESIRNEAAKFADFWHAKSGKDATKLDWLATWRNWCRNAKVSVPGRGGFGPMNDTDRAAANAQSTADAARLLGFDEQTLETFDAKA